MRLSVVLVKPPGKKFICPVPNKLPVAPVNKPVPPAMLKVKEKGATKLTGGRTAFPLAVPNRVLPEAEAIIKANRLHLD